MTGIGQTAAMSGNLGGGSEGVMRANYMSNQDANRALLQSKLLQQGFDQANLNAQTAFNQQGTIRWKPYKISKQQILTSWVDWAP